MIPGTVSHRFSPQDGDRENAEWLLALVDSSPDRLAIVTIPFDATDDDVDAIEDVFIRAYDLAREDRPDLTVKLLPGVDLRNGAARARAMAAVHEHEWVGGACVRGCREKRPMDGGTPAA